MTVQLAPIRTNDLQAGDTLQHRNGSRWTITERACSPLSVQPTVEVGWWAAGPGLLDLAIILDTDIDRTGPDRIWWLDSCTERP